jgi:NADH:ubiquinone oxidoreductase subunit C
VTGEELRAEVVRILTADAKTKRGRALAETAASGGLAVELAHDDVFVRLELDAARPALEALAKAGFSSLVFVTAVDRPTEMTIVWRLAHMGWGQEVFVECQVGREAPEAPSVVDLWPAADWHERETYDLFGVRFAGHPDLRRLLLPEDWVGHPLRKDYEDASMVKRPNYI